MQRNISLARRGLLVASALDRITHGMTAVSYATYWQFLFMKLPSLPPLLSPAFSAGVWGEWKCLCKQAIMKRPPVENETEVQTYFSAGRFPFQKWRTIWPFAHLYTAYFRYVLYLLKHPTDFYPGRLTARSRLRRPRQRENLWDQGNRLPLVVEFGPWNFLSFGFAFASCFVFQTASSAQLGYIYYCFFTRPIE